MDKDDQIIVQITAKMMHLHEQGQEWISTSDLIRQTHKPKNKLQEALDTMETMGRVAVTYSETGKKGRRATYYKLIFE
jgi:DNA-binding IclR family transcriptional regulator